MMFKVSFKKFLNSWGLNNDEISRLSNRLLDTQKESVALHLEGYLKSMGIEDHAVCEIEKWWRFRGRIAHGDSVDPNELRQVVNQIAQAVQNALKKELSLL